MTYTLRLLRLAALIALFFSAASATDLVMSTPTFCGEGGGCSAVRESPVGQQLGTSLPWLGLSAYTLIFWGTLLPSMFARRIMLYATLLGALIGGGLLATQWLTAHRFCGLCVGADVAALLAAVFAVLALRRPPVRATTWPLTAWATMFVLAIGVPPAFALSRPAPLPDYIAERMTEDAIDVIEVSDFQCPYCRGLHKVLRPLLEAHKDDVRFSRLSFPLRGHAHAYDAAGAYLCARQQERGEAMAHRLFTEADIRLSALPGHAAAIGLQETAFAECMKSPETGQAVRALQEELREGGAEGVPQVWIEGRLVAGFDEDKGKGPYERALSAALAGRPVTLRPLPFMVLGVLLSILVTLGVRAQARRRKE